MTYAQIERKITKLSKQATNAMTEAAARPIRTEISKLRAQLRQIREA